MQKDQQFGSASMLFRTLWLFYLSLVSWKHDFHSQMQCIAHHDETTQHQSGSWSWTNVWQEVLQGKPGGAQHSWDRVLSWLHSVYNDTRAVEHHLVQAARQVTGAKSKISHEKFVQELPETICLSLQRGSRPECRPIRISHGWQPPCVSLAYSTGNSPIYWSLLVGLCPLELRSLRVRPIQ